MRLIDADTLLEELKKSCKWHAESSRELSLLQRDINIVKEQPTVDAVPVDFIRSEIERMKKGSNRYYSECEAYADDLDILLAEWERRQ